MRGTIATSVFPIVVLCCAGLVQAQLSRLQIRRALADISTDASTARQRALLQMEPAETSSHWDIFESLEDAKAACPTKATTNMLIGAAFSNMQLIEVFHFSAEQVAPMICSWLRHAPDTHIVMFSNKGHSGDGEHYINLKSKYHAEHLPEANVNVVLLKDPIAAPWRKIMLHMSALKDFEVNETNVADWKWLNWRFVVSLAFLELCQHSQGVAYTGGIMSADLRDTLLQDNIWDNPNMQRAVRENLVIFALEGNVFEDGTAKRLRIRDEGWNNDKITKCFGHLNTSQTHASGLTLEVLRDGYVSNSGTIMGGAQAMISYLQTVFRFYKTEATTACWNLPGSDQAIHTYLLALSLHNPAYVPFKPLVLPNNASSPVYNAGCGMPISVSYDTGVITVQRGSYHFRPYFIHQFDRDVVAWETARPFARAFCNVMAPQGA